MVLSTNNQSLEIDLAKGGAISKLTLFSNGKHRTVISPQSDYHYESSFLFPFPNRLTNGKYSFNGQDFKFPINDFGRPNALHGLISDKPFSVLNQLEDSLVLSYTYGGELPYYPFPFDLSITYTLHPGILSIDVSIENTGNSAMPCGFGWHPYFNLEGGADQVRIELQNVVKVCVDENLIPTGRTTPYKTLEEGQHIDQLSLDDCFMFSKSGCNQSTKLLFPDGSCLEVRQDEQNPFVQVYTPEDQKTIAIEPMTCGINALNTGNGLKVLQPKETWSFQFGVSFK